MARGSDSMFLRSGAESLRAWSPADDQALREQERRRAARTVARNAVNAEDCHELQAMLGVLPGDAAPTGDTTASE